MRRRSAVYSAATLVTLSCLTKGAMADITQFSSAVAFQSATGVTNFESFEELSARVRSAAPLTVPGFTVTPDAATLGVLDGVNSPEPNFGAFATDGTKALFVFNPDLPTGTLRFDLAAPATAFGFHITDVGEAAGDITIRTNAGETLTPATLATYPPLRDNGNEQFLGFSQSTPFTQVFLTVNIPSDSYGLDQVFVQTAAPEPGPLGLILVSGLPLISAVRRRR